MTSKEIHYFNIILKYYYLFINYFISCKTVPILFQNEYIIPSINNKMISN